MRVSVVTAIVLWATSSEVEVSWHKRKGKAAKKTQL
jgi:hypothetical protein